MTSAQDSNVDLRLLNKTHYKDFELVEKEGRLV